MARGQQQEKTEAEVTNWMKQYLETGDSQYWGRIFEKYKRQIFVHCLRMLNNNEDAEDLASETFIKAFENIQSYDLKRPFSPWLNQIATNLCIDHIRRKTRIQFQQLEEHVRIEETEPTVMANEENRELRKKIKQAIGKLKRPQKRCFCLFYIQQKSYKEIAELTGYSYNKVRSHIQNGRRKFKLVMER